MLFQLLFSSYYLQLIDFSVSVISFTYNSLFHNRQKLYEQCTIQSTNIPGLINSLAHNIFSSFWEMPCNPASSLLDGSSCQLSDCRIQKNTFYICLWYICLLYKISSANGTCINYSTEIYLFLTIVVTVFDHFHFLFQLYVINIFFSVILSYQLLLQLTEWTLLKGFEFQGKLIMYFTMKTTTICCLPVEWNWNFHVFTLIPALNHHEIVLYFPSRFSKFCCSTHISSRSLFKIKQLIRRDRDI